MRFETPSGPFDVEIGEVTVAGWTGRDVVGVRHHIEELAAIGVPGPSEVPLFYHVSASLLTQTTRLQVLGAQTSGEVEPLIVRTGDSLWLGLASDHTDRGLEAHSVAASKQACAKPVAAELWNWDDMVSHLDEIRLRSWIIEGGVRVPYQDGAVGQILPLDDLVRRSGLMELPLSDDEGAAMLCGTVPVLSGGIWSSALFEMEMFDHIRSCSIRHTYRVSPLDVVR